MASKRKNPHVFLDVSVDGDPAERMLFELFHDVVPKTAENFRALCTGEKGIGPTTGKPLHFKGSFFHQIIKGLMAQAGDFSKRDGSGGESIYGQKFEDESFKLTHDGSGFLSMANDGPDKNGSQFLITFKAAHHLDGKHVVFGKLVQGRETLKKIEHIGGSGKGKPECTVKIVNCGEHLEDKKKANKLKVNEASPNADSLEVKRRGKHKKTSRDRRRKRRRRYYSSESDSSSDSEADSSEFESDSDSDSSSSSSGISSSSDDRHKKRKRASRRGKLRHGRKRDKRREKRRRWRDKKSRRKSTRISESSSDSKSDSTSGSISDDEKVEARACSTRRSRNSKSSAKIQSPLSKERVEVILVQKNGEMTNVLQRGGDSPKENGKLRSNGTDTKSARNADKQPDLVDAHPSKTRSGSSPKRITSKSMSISPVRRLSKSPSVSPKRRSLSRSPQRSGDRSSAGPPQQSRNISQSPARRSVSSRSPDRNASPSPVRIRAVRDFTRSPSLPGRSISCSPVRSLQRRSTSRSLIRPPRHSRSPAKSSWRSSSRSPVRTSRRSLSRSRSPIRRAPSTSPIRRAPRRSPSRSPGRVLPRRSISRSPVRSAGRNNRRRYSKSPVSPCYRGRSPIHNRGRSLSRSASPDGSPKRLRRGHGFSQKYSYARRYRTPAPDRSPIRPQRYGGRGDRDRYSTYSSYHSPPRRHRSPPRGRTPPRYRGRRSWSRSRSVSRSPIRNKGPGKANYSRSPTHSRSPVEKPSSRRGESLRSEKRRSVSRSTSRSKSVSRSSGNTPSPKHGGNDVKSRSPSAGPPAGNGLVSYWDGSPDSSLR